MATLLQMELSYTECSPFVFTHLMENPESTDILPIN